MRGSTPVVRRRSQLGSSPWSTSPEDRVRGPELSRRDTDRASALIDLGWSRAARRWPGVVGRSRAEAGYMGPTARTRTAATIRKRLSAMTDQAAIASESNRAEDADLSAGVGDSERFPTLI